MTINFISVLRNAELAGLVSSLEFVGESRWGWSRVGFVQSVIDWKCKPESVQGGPSEGEETMLRRGRGNRTSALVWTDRWPLVSTTAWRNSPIGKTAFRADTETSNLILRPSVDCSLNLTPVPIMFITLYIASYSYAQCCFKITI